MTTASLAPAPGSNLGRLRPHLGMAAAAAALADAGVALGEIAAVTGVTPDDVPDLIEAAALSGTYSTGAHAALIEAAKSGALRLADAPPATPGQPCAAPSADVDDWFPDPADPGPDDVQARAGLARRARILCAGCPAMAECLGWALATGDTHAVHAGLAPHEVRAIARQRHRRTLAAVTS